jgi:predicted SnoaL-like aldol condensation-catalyzing enzyme
MFSTVSHPRTNQPGPRWKTAASQRVAAAYFDTLLIDIPSGSAGLREQFTAFFQQFPQLIVERKRVVAEGDIVAIHAHYRLNPDDRGQSVVDIFRVRDGKVVEHWDVVQDVPATSANDNTMF